MAATSGDSNSKDLCLTGKTYYGLFCHNSNNFPVRFYKDTLQAYYGLLCTQSLRCVNIGVFGIGCMYSWTSPSLPKLRSRASWLPIDADQASWIGSLIGFGAIFGSLLGGWLVDHIGRRPTIVLAVGTGLISWGVLYITQEVWEIYVSRIIAGLGGGIVFTAVPLYVGEISEDSVRSTLSTLFNCFFTAGLVLEYLVGPYISFWSLIWVSSIPMVIFFMTCPWMPESPYFHLQNNYDVKAFNNLSWLRKGFTKDQVMDEVKMIKESVEELKKNKGTVLDLFGTRGNRRAMLISCSIVIFQQLCGINVMLFYTETIFEMAGTTSLNPSESTILVGLILLGAATLAIPLTHYFGTKALLLTSAIGMAIFLTTLGFYFFMVHEGKDTSSYHWLPVTSLIGFVVLYSFGFGPLPWAVVAEMFPPHVKGIASAVNASSCWAMSFVLTKLFPTIAELFGTHVVFWFFAVCSISAFLFVLIFLPDTRGMSLQEIQDYLNQTSREDTVVYK